MSTSLTRNAFARHPLAFAGTVVTQSLAALIVTVAMLTSGAVSDRSLPAAVRATLAERDVGPLFLAFLLVSVYLSILVIGVTTAAGLTRQRPAVALVRAVGATPGQVRRAVAAQNLLLAVPAALVGAGVGQALAPAWLRLLQNHGVVPAAVTAQRNVAAVFLALAVVVVTSVAGGLVAAVRVSRQRPSWALTGTAAGRRGHGWIRTAVGTAMLAGTTALSVLASRHDPRDAADAAPLVLLAGCVATGLVGPVLVRVAAPVLRAAGGPGSLARDNLRVYCRPLSAALVPLTLAAAFVAVKIGAHTSTVAAGRRTTAADVWLDYTGTGVYVAFAAVAALTVLVSTATARRAEFTRLRRTGATRAAIARLAALESAAVAVGGLVGAALVATVTLVPLVHGTTGASWPRVPAGAVAGIVAATLALVVGGGVAAALGASRRPAAEAGAA